MLQKITLTIIGNNIARREAEGMKYIGILELVHKVICASVHFNQEKIKVVSQSIFHSSVGFQPIA